MSVTLCKLVKIKKETRGNFTIQINFALNSSQILLCDPNVNPDLVLKSLEWNMVIALDTKKTEGERRPVMLYLIDSFSFSYSMQTLDNPGLVFRTC